jgi:hypothetical protein
MPETAAMVRAPPAIKDHDTFRQHWPTSVHASEWRTSLDSLVDSLAHVSVGRLACRITGCLVSRCHIVAGMGGRGRTVPIRVV